MSDRSGSSFPKKHKKHHKKHKKKKSHRLSESEIDVVSEVPPPIEKLKLSTPSRPIINSNTTTPSSSTTKSQKRRKGKSKDSGTSSDEERWLDAIESGKLEEVDDELKKIKDPKLMTARQRAMYERSTDKEPSPTGEVLMSLPTGYKEKVLTAEAIQKAQLKSQKRKQLADEKREKDKKKTMERLLKKQDSTKIGKQTKVRIIRTSDPVISYKNTLEGGLITLPPNVEFSLKPQLPRDSPKVQICAIPGCSNRKIYNCSKTNIPLCSFACYKKNLLTISDIIC